MQRFLYLALVFSAMVQAELRIDVPAQDVAQLKAESSQDSKPPFRYAKSIATGKLADASHKNLSGWKQQGDESVWQAVISAPDAISLDVGLSNVFLPGDAKLLWFAPGEKHSITIATMSDVSRKGTLWLPILAASEAVLEVRVPTELQNHITFSLDTIHYGFRDTLTNSKSGSCNVDVACDAGDGWEDPINSVARYTTGGFLCTGQAIDSAGSEERLFLTADHCFDPGTADGMVFYWKYESPFCRAPGSASSGSALPTSGNSIVQMGGAEMLSRWAGSDFALVRMSQTPPQSAAVFQTGWNRADEAPDMATSIHHPQGHAKRISHENDPLTITNYLQNSGGDTHLRVGDWDEGTTEGGSSGSGLWNPQQQLIGQLSGGFAACGNNSPDWYGRMNKNWEGNGNSSTRVKDYLDPQDTGLMSLGGTNQCDQPSVSIVSTVNPAKAGENIQFVAQVSGGQGPYTYAWELDGDGLVDGDQDTQIAKYPARGNYVVSVTVTDALDCPETATLGQSVTGADILVSPQGGWVEIAGNGDEALDPGETWRHTVDFENIGDDSLPDAYAVIVPTAATEAENPVQKRTGGPSESGYTFSDSDEASCPYDFVDISSTGNNLNFTAATQFPALDDGASMVMLDTPFPFYGVNYAELIMSSNGYLSTNLNDNGGDYDNDCAANPVTPDLGFPGRIMPFHDDLIAGSAQYQYFAQCPRPTNSTQGCSILQWTDVTFFGSQTPPFQLQALLYDDGSMAFQKANASGTDAGGATVGILNPAVTEQLIYACDAGGQFSDNMAVCYQAPAEISDDFRVDTPLVGLGNFLPNNTKTRNLTVTLDQDITCGTTISLDLAGVVGTQGFSKTSDVQFLKAEVGQGGQCEIFNSGMMPDPLMVPTDGGYLDTKRGGAGVDVRYFPGSQLVSVGVFGHRPNHQPVLYTMVDTASSSGQTCDVLLEPSSPPPFTSLTNTEVGRACVQFSDSDSGVLAIQWQDGSYVLERMELFGEGTIDRHEGLWLSNSEAWGVSYIDLGGGVDTVATYFWRDDGTSTWTFGPYDAAMNTGTLDILSGHCHGCVWIPTAETPVGTMSWDWDDGDTAAEFNSNQVLPPSQAGSLIRNDHLINIFSIPPENP